jgi:hypothetical protein
VNSETTPKRGGRPSSLPKTLDVFDLAAQRATEQGRAGLYVEEAAYITGLNPSTIRAFVKDRAIPSYLVERRVGNRIVSEQLIDAAGLRDWIASKRVAAVAS